MASVNKKNGRLGQFVHVKAQGQIPAPPQLLDERMRFRLVVGCSENMRVSVPVGSVARLDTRQGANISVRGALHRAGQRVFMGARSGISAAVDATQYAWGEAQGELIEVREEYGDFCWADLMCNGIPVSALLNARLRRLIENAERGETVRLSGDLEIVENKIELAASKILFESVIRNKKGR